MKSVLQREINLLWWAWFKNIVDYVPDVWAGKTEMGFFQFD